MLKKLSIKIYGHSTSITLEQEFLTSLKDIAKAEKKSLTMLITEIDHKRDINTNLCSAIRVYILNYFKKKLFS